MSLRARRQPALQARADTALARGVNVGCSKIPLVSLDPHPQARPGDLIRADAQSHVPGRLDLVVIREVAGCDRPLASVAAADLRVAHRIHLAAAQALDAVGDEECRQIRAAAARRCAERALELQALRLGLRRPGANANRTVAASAARDGACGISTLTAMRFFDCYNRTITPEEQRSAKRSKRAHATHAGSPRRRFAPRTAAPRPPPRLSRPRIVTPMRVSHPRALARGLDPVRPFSLAPASADASFRRYFRVFP